VQAASVWQADVHALPLIEALSANETELLQVGAATASYFWIWNDRDEHAWVKYLQRILLHLVAHA